MEDTWRKAKHFGLGVLDFTREKVETVVNDMVKRGELSEQDTAEAVANIMERAKSEQEAFLDMLRGVVEKIVAELGLARSSELEALKKRVAELEEKH
jgi:polyhydroxyalkanoate synthesis regulator phasin